MLRASNLRLRWSGLATLVGGMLHALGDLLNLTHLGAPFAESIGSPASAAFRLAAGGFLVSYGVFSLGWLLVGVATLRTHFLPRLAVVFLIIGAILTFPAVPSPPRTDVILGVAIAWLGLDLLSSRGATTQRTSRVRRTS